MRRKQVKRASYLRGTTLAVTPVAVIVAMKATLRGDLAWGSGAEVILPGAIVVACFAVMKRFVLSGLGRGVSDRGQFLLSRSVAGNTL